MTDEEKPRDAQDVAFARALVEVAALGETGVLDVQGEGVFTTIYFDDGRLVFVDGGPVGSTLGRVLVDQGVLTPEQYEETIQRLASSGSDALFGETAVSMGLLTEEQVAMGLREQVAQKAMGCLHWEAVEFEFTADPEAVREVPHHPLDIMPLILRGVQRSYDAERTERLLGSERQRFPRITQPAADIAGWFELTPEQEELIRAMDGSRSFDESLSFTGLDHLTAEHVTAALVLADLVDFLGEPVSRPVSRPGAKVARVALKAVPASAARPGADGERSLQRAAKERVSQPVVEVAPQSVRDAAESPEALLKRQRLQAEALFQQGKRALRERRYAEALTALGGAVELYPEAAEYELYATWARFKTLDDAGEMKAARARLKAAAVKAIRQDRHMAFAHYVAARLFLMAGNEKAAVAGFSMALELDPSDEESRRQLERLRGSGAG